MTKLKIKYDPIIDLLLAYGFDEFVIYEFLRRNESNKTVIN